MLTATQRRYIEICQEKIATNKTNEALAKQFGGKNRALVDRALRWGREHDLFTLDVGAKISLRIAELYKLVERLERDFLRVHRRPRTSPATWRPDYHSACRLAREIRETRKLAMELEGMYRQVVSHTHSAPDGGPVRIEYEIIETPVDHGPSAN